jgi:hypothetical protein
VARKRFGAVKNSSRRDCDEFKQHTLQFRQTLNRNERKKNHLSLSYHEKTLFLLSQASAAPATCKENYGNPPEFLHLSDTPNLILLSPFSTTRLRHGGIYEYSLKTVKEMIDPFYVVRE